MTKFLKVLTPASYSGPAVWINPAFFSYAKYEGAKNTQTIVCLPACQRSLLASSKPPKLVQLDIVTVKPAVAGTQIDKSDEESLIPKGVLFVNPITVAVLTENKLSPNSTKLIFIDAQGGAFDTLKHGETVDGTPQGVAKKLSIALRER